MPVWFDPRGPDGDETRARQEDAVGHEDAAASVLADRPLAGTDLELVEWQADPAPGGGPSWQAPLHVHHADDEAWYVLSGRMVFRLDEEVHELSAGGAVMAHAGVPHTFGAIGDHPARYLLVMTPRIAALVAALHDADLAAGRSMAQLFADHRSSLLE